MQVLNKKKLEINFTFIRKVSGGWSWCDMRGGQGKCQGGGGRGSNNKGQLWCTCNSSRGKVKE